MLKKNRFSGQIPGKLYKKIVDLMPICCIDCVLEANGKFYLFKRAYEPAKGKWWLIGGRILKGERLEDAAIRKVKEEIGVDVSIKKMLGVYEIFLDRNRFSKAKKKNSSHSVAICYLVEPKGHFNISLNEEYTSFKAIEKQEKGLHPYISSVLEKAGVKK